MSKLTVFVLIRARILVQMTRYRRHRIGTNTSKLTEVIAFVYIRARILIIVTIYPNLRVGRDDYLDQSRYILVILELKGLVLDTAFNL